MSPRSGRGAQDSTVSVLPGLVHSLNSIQPTRQGLTTALLPLPLCRYDSHRDSILREGVRDAPRLDPLTRAITVSAQPRPAQVNFDSPDCSDSLRADPAPGRPWYRRRLLRWRCRRSSGR